MHTTNDLKFNEKCVERKISDHNEIETVVSNVFCIYILFSDTDCSAQLIKKPTI